VILPVAVLAGGLATRLRPITERIPKSLVEVAGRPFVEHQIALLRQQGIHDVVFCVGFLGEQVQDALGDGSRWSMRFRYSFDGAQLVGTGGALRRALPMLGDAFFVLYGDSYLTCNFSDVAESFRVAEQPALMTVYRNDDQFDRSNVRFEEGRIVRYDKINRDPAMRHIDYGLGVLTPEAFAPWLDRDEPLDLAVVYQQLVVRGALAGYEVTERFYEIGSPEGLAATEAFLTSHAS